MADIVMNRTVGNPILAALNRKPTRMEMSRFMGEMPVTNGSFGGNLQTTQQNPFGITRLPNSNIQAQINWTNASGATQLLCFGGGLNATTNDPQGIEELAGVIGLGFANCVIPGRAAVSFNRTAASMGRTGLLITSLSVEGGTGIQTLRAPMVKFNGTQETYTNFLNLVQYRRPDNFQPNIIDIPIDSGLVVGTDAYFGFELLNGQTFACVINFNIDPQLVGALGM